jgi:hypothetical protein
MNEVTKHELLRIEPVALADKAKDIAKRKHSKKKKTVALADIAKDIEHQLGQRAREPNVRPKANNVQPHHDVRVPEYNSQKSVPKYLLHRDTRVLLRICAGPGRQPSAQILCADGTNSQKYSLVSFHSKNTWALTFENLRRFRKIVICERICC